MELIQSRFVTKGIFTTKADSGYDDDRTSRYHFPKQYLEKVRATVDDLIVYYEPRRNGGRSAYIASVRVTSVLPDPNLSDHYYAQVTDYLDFENPVPFRKGGDLFEKGLASGGKTGLSGDFRNAVRLVSDHEFEMILAEGFLRRDLASANSSRETAIPNMEFAEESQDFDHQRPVVTRLASRLFRDEAFARNIKRAYDATCAFTGLSMRNGGGRTEVEAAHIKPVGDGHCGPDAIRNGLALSKTVHWMFDRGLLSIDDDFKILKARSLVPEPISRLLAPNGYAQVPTDPKLQPHRAFLEYHRNKIFKESRN